MATPRQAAEILFAARAHALDTGQALEQLGSGVHGLSVDEAARRLESCGPNALPPAAPVPAWKRFLRQFQSLFIYVLFLSAGISFLLGHLVDSAVILAVVSINAIIGFIQEGKAEEALRAILSMTETHALVLRQGKQLTLDSRELVPGDIVILQAGDRVPADLRILESREFRCDESLLTGESQARDKNAATMTEDTPLAERDNMAFMGTMTVAGSARGVVVGTGVQTEIGSINTLVQGVGASKTPMQLQLARLTRNLTLGVLLIAVLAIAVGMLLHGFGFADMLQGAIAIAVAAIPEELPAVVTIVLAIGVQRMARKHALVRRLPAVEVLGSVDVICTDKTGTLTANAMTARVVTTAGAEYRVQGEGYAPEGDFADENGQTGMENNPCLQLAGRIALLCNDSGIMETPQGWAPAGDPTEAALHVLARKAGLDQEAANREWERVDVLPFDADYRYMATLNRDGDGLQLLLKGAPEQVLNFCTQQAGSKGKEPMDQDYWRAAMDTLAGAGMRVMALACKAVTGDAAQLERGMAEQDLVMVALVGLSDPPRTEAVQAIADCHAAGIRVKMITGDNPLTASAIGRELGLDTSRVLTGAELDDMDEQAFAAVVESVDIYARTSPRNKLQLVKSLQQNRHVVAMTGDGVNDAPALRQADIGVAMGLKGTDASREAADFVLTDDNFATIAGAVREGRNVYDNTLKSIVFMLPTNLAEMFIVLLAILLGWVLPISAPQILWINMVTTVTLSLALAFEPAERGIMNRPPRPYRQGFLTPLLVWRLLLVGGTGALIVFLLFFSYLDRGASLELARSVTVNAMVMIEIFYLLSCRFLYQGILNREAFAGYGAVLTAILIVVVAQLLFTYLPFFQNVFEVEPLQLGDWILLTLSAALILVVVEVDKAIARIFHRDQKQFRDSAAA